jgi:predicted transcriptional regulator
MENMFMAERKRRLRQPGVRVAADMRSQRWLDDRPGLSRLDQRSAPLEPS